MVKKGILHHEGLKSKTSRSARPLGPIWRVIERGISALAGQHHAITAMLIPAANNMPCNGRELHMTHGSFSVSNSGLAKVSQGCNGESPAR